MPKKRLKGAKDAQTSPPTTDKASTVCVASLALYFMLNPLDIHFLGLSHQILDPLVESILHFNTLPPHFHPTHNPYLKTPYEVDWFV
jgi:hypothetical protein